MGTTLPLIQSTHRSMAGRTALLALLALGLASHAPAQPAAPLLPNKVEISPSLVTSGQPSAEALAGLQAQGFEAVIYLAPPTVHDAVRDEPLIVARQGMSFINLPIRFDRPTEADFETFAALLKALGGRKTLVHCQVNMRASTLVFLYRVIHLAQPPQTAYDAVTKIWVPQGPWRQLAADQLLKHKIDFELF
jgi:protein tyrosine phosphatase (PTP) superfamily phosphohydrolase (DUF442 family)